MNKKQEQAKISAEQREQVKEMMLKINLSDSNQ